MKHLINNPADVVLEMAKGIVLAHPELELLEKYKVIKKKNLNQDKVTLISGGGSGHEPAHAGYIGKGMLDVAVCGDVFSSPSQVQVYQAIKETASSKGTLLIIKNYSGDMMNFKNAAHMAKEDDILVDYVKVDDDIAVQDSLYTVGRRGVAGTVFVHKIAGAAAERGYDLQDVKRVAKKAAKHVKSLGVGLTSCTLPGSAEPILEMSEGEMEFGIGIHGEPGIRREKVQSADEISERIVNSLLKALEIDQDSSDDIALLVNGFGGTTLQELYLLNYSVFRQLADKNVNVTKVLVGNYMTALNMAGASISILKLDEELKDLLSDECDTPALKLKKGLKNIAYRDLIQAREEQSQEAVSYRVEANPNDSYIKNNRITLNNVMYMVDVGATCIIRNEEFFCDLDSHVGDGDFGTSLANGFKQLKNEWKRIIEDHSNDIGAFLEACSLIIMEYCGGASGPIWGSAFRAAGKYAVGKKELTLDEFAKMIDHSVAGIQATGERSFGRGAEVGDKTLIDALVPYAKMLQKCALSNDRILSSLGKAAKAAREGAESTKEIPARLGRAGTVGDRSIGYPDAGAYGLSIVLTEISMAMKEQ